MKALMIATRPEWVKKIINGEKDLEFRNYAIPKGTRVLVYESLGKFSQKIIPVSETNPMPRYAPSYEGRGKVVLEFVVGECLKHTGEYLTEYNNDIDKVVFENAVMIKEIDYQQTKNMGYTNQKYAHTITDLIVYDEEWQYDAGCNPITMMRLDWLSGIPTEPQPISNYVGCSKVEKFKNEYWNEIVQHNIKWIDGKPDWYQFEECKLTHPPQGRVWIYMEDK